MRAVSQPVVPRDITEKFTQAASKLRTGQLVKDEYFTLFEAVGALEIMDSKMDSGYLSPDENNAQGFEDDYDVMRDLTLEEVVGIMDELLCHEMAWHMGHPLSQTLFTSIYLDRLLWPVPQDLEDANFGRGKAVENNQELGWVHIVLRAYCLGLVKCCDFVHSRVAAEYYYEEEDFVTQLYNRSLLSKFDYELFCNLLDRACAWIDEQSIVDEKMKSAIKVRLEFRHKFLLGLQHGAAAVQTRSTDNFKSCLSMLGTLQESTGLGQPVAESFSVKMQRRLASSVPPRPMVNISIEDALAHLKRLCQDGVDIQEIFNYRGPCNFKVAIWTLLSRKPQPSVYIRSLLQAIIFDRSSIAGTVPIKQFLYDELAEVVLPSSVLLEASVDETEMPSNPRFQIARQMDGFVKRFSQPFVDTIRSACLNRCRIRRNVCHTIVDWDNLQIEAEDLDEQLRTLSDEPPLLLQNGDATYSYPLSSWAYHEKLLQFRLILQLGFELSIYAPEELAGMYWYLSHICSTHLGHIDRIRTFMVAAAKRNLASSPGTKRLAVERQAAFQRSHYLLERLTTQIVAIDAFAISLHALYVVLARHNRVPTASSAQAYSNDRLRYELRMKPFLPITLPELVPYDEYRREARLEGDGDDVVMERATKAIAEARKAWEATLANGAFLQDSRGEAVHAPALEEDWTRDVKDTMRACIGASIAIESVNKALQGSTTTMANVQVNIPETGSKSRWHDWWVVPQVLQGPS
ncbi:hypothetical protein P175DRAFT_0503313 [Aspergillus ochraceoroseus IBT 24754]|uniref:Amino-acid N-acetyltransferase subunit Mak10 n=2 Tax=Aspergillus ochraceoroseus TaxID=138278 RepID=A0A2T5LQF0_9EURO|nr:uncharacterized protein P175DRAFT_0503313 [Aspergillus ochraceoroseus IBT 24754]KKK20763.1 putative amino-acid N-acetyltransferase subunit Mak10 [Aspergillus ochraceoroseus]PTU18514.1 hypothetical protein P175DRAFT_0503313 [Aspergillus ochraceoroseus IBT 24754]